MTVEIIFNDKTIQIVGLKKIDIKTLKTFFDFDEKKFVINMVINDMIISLMDQTIIVNDTDNYKIFLLGEDSSLEEFFAKNKIINRTNLFLKNDEKIIAVDNMKVLNTGTLKKLFDMFKININNLIINICIYNANQIISEIRLNEGQNWLVNSELTYILKIDTQDGYSAIMINDFFSESSRIFYNDSIVTENKATFTIYDETLQYKVKVNGLTVINFETIRRFIYEKLKILNILSINFEFTCKSSTGISQLNIYENTYLINDHDYKLVITVNKEAPQILHDRIEGFMVRNNNTTIHFDNIEVKKKIVNTPLTNIMKPKEHVNIPEQDMFNDDFNTLLEIYKSKPELFDTLNKFLTKSDKSNIQFDEELKEQVLAKPRVLEGKALLFLEHDYTNEINIFSEFISEIISYTIDKTCVQGKANLFLQELLASPKVVQTKLEKYHYHLNLALRDLFCS